MHAIRLMQTEDSLFELCSDVQRQSREWWPSTVWVSITLWIIEMMLPVIKRAYVSRSGSECPVTGARHGSMNTDVLLSYRCFGSSCHLCEWLLLIFNCARVVCDPIYKFLLDTPTSQLLPLSWMPIPLTSLNCVAHIRWPSSKLPHAF